MFPPLKIQAGQAENWNPANKNIMGNIMGLYKTLCITAKIGPYSPKNTMVHLRQELRPELVDRDFKIRPKMVQNVK